MTRLQPARFSHQLPNSHDWLRRSGGTWCGAGGELSRCDPVARSGLQGTAPPEVVASAMRSTSGLEGDRLAGYAAQAGGHQAFDVPAAAPIGW
jgi:hypothetical protein